MARVDRGLAVDWVSPGSVNIPAAMRFPGEILHVYDGGTSRAYARYAAAITGVEPMPTDNSARALATPEQALELLGSESPADVQLAAVHQARKQLGIPRAAPQPFIELTAPGTG
ncbi:hypothetical protein [Streptomyces hirsutus]|uniref:hypothetical protein n=1 Tax=Streptomyces hirsutus TaxID=35620 RepID=UPI003659E17B